MIIICINFYEAKYTNKYEKKTNKKNNNFHFERFISLRSLELFKRNTIFSIHSLNEFRIKKRPWLQLMKKKNWLIEFMWFFIHLI